MYTIYADNLLIYDPGQKDYAITSGKLTRELNTSGKLTFSIPKDNPHYGMINLMKSIVTLYDDDRLLFRGRPFAPSLDLYEMDEIECEGELAFLNDSFQVPFDRSTGDVETLFRRVLAFHNSQVSEEKRFEVGRVTAINAGNESGGGNITRSSDEYLTTWEYIKKKFIKTPVGGYLWTRHEGGKTYIDYLSDMDYISGQAVTQGINLKDAQKESTSEDLATVVVPLGKKVKVSEDDEKETYTTIESVNGGKIYVEDEKGVSTYGRIVKITKHDNITEPLNLLRAGKADLAAALGVKTSIELSAADLSKAGYKIDPFEFGSYVDVSIKNLGIDEKMLIKKMTIDLLKPGSNSIKLGHESQSFTVQQINTAQTQENITREMREDRKNASHGSVRLRRDIATMINESAEGLKTRVQETYYDKAKIDDIVKQQSSAIQQSADEVRLDFSKYEEKQDGINEGTAQRFAQLSTYIRFSQDGMEIGEKDSHLTLKLKNDRISFLESGNEVAYISDNRLYIHDGEFISKLYLGNFGFEPRPTGNLSFLKVR